MSIIGSDIGSKLSMQIRFILLNEIVCRHREQIKLNTYSYLLQKLNFF